MARMAGGVTGCAPHAGGHGESVERRIYEEHPHVGQTAPWRQPCSEQQQARACGLAGPQGRQDGRTWVRKVRQGRRGSIIYDRPQAGGLSAPKCQIREHAGAAERAVRVGKHAGGTASEHTQERLWRETQAPSATRGGAQHGNWRRADAISNLHRTLVL